MKMHSTENPPSSIKKRTVNSPVREMTFDNGGAKFHRCDITEVWIRPGFSDPKHNYWELLVVSPDGRRTCLVASTYDSFAGPHRTRKRVPLKNYPF